MTLLRRPAVGALSLVSLVQVAYLWPLLQTGYMNDDLFNVDDRSAARLAGDGFVAHWLRDTDMWIDTVGRWFPLALLQTYGEFHLIQDRLAYKALLLVCVIGATLAVALLLLRLGMTAVQAGLVVLVATLCMQFRAWHDPIVSYAGLQQVVLAEVAVSVLLFHVWLRDGRRLALAGSLVLMILASSTYESSPLLVVLHLAVAVHERGAIRPGVRAAGPLLACGAAFLAVSLVLRALATRALTQYEPRLDPDRVAASLAEQVLGTVPLTHVLFDPFELFTRDTLAPVALGAVIAGLAFGAATWWLLRRAAPADGDVLARPGGVRLMVALGIGLIVVPAAPIALATKYQDELRLGLAYLPVFIQAFGLALLVVCGAAALRRRVGATAWAPAAAGAAVLVACVAAVSFEANLVVRDRSRDLQRTRDVAAAALRAGLLEGVPEGSRLATSAGIENRPQFYFRFTGRRFAPAAAPAAFAGTRDAGVTGTYVALRLDQALAAPLDGRAPARVYVDGGATTATLPAGADPDSFLRVGPGLGLATVGGCTLVDPSRPRALVLACRDGGSVAVVNTGGDEETLELRLALAARGDVEIDAAGERSRAAGSPAGAPVSVVRRVRAAPGTAVPVRFATDGEPIDPSGAQLRITGLSVTRAG